MEVKGEKINCSPRKHFDQYTLMHQTWSTARTRHASFVMCSIADVLTGTSIKQKIHPFPCDYICSLAKYTAVRRTLD